MIMKKFICSMMAAIVFLLSPISAYASTTESAYEVMPLHLHDTDEVAHLSAYFDIGDYNLNSYGSNSSTVSIDFPSNIRIDSVSNRYYKDSSLATNITNYDNTLRAVYNFSSADGEPIFDTLTGAKFDINGLFFNCFYFENDVRVNINVLSRQMPVKASYRLYRLNENSLVSYKTGDINLNDLYLNDSSLGLFLDFPADSLSYYNIYAMDITLYFDLPSYEGNVDKIVGRMGFYYDDSYFYCGTSMSESTNQDDYNKNVEAELGNIQTGINNVINSVVQMGNQAWEGAQQTVQAVTQMTEQLNSAIDQQRQDILEGLGLLGDDLDSSLNNVKTEITNIGSSITNKLESTTESITNKIESTTETITNTIETKVDEVTTAVDNVKESVTEVKNSILDLPNKIKDMLLGLIVPDAETMSSKFSEFSGLLEQKLGVIYQIPMMLFDFFDTIVNAATTPQTSLTLPAFTLPWIDGTTLTVWQSVEYNIIPEGMEVLSDLIQTITSMTVVVLTFNSVKRAYERFLRS